jgi:peptidoglycan/xylan/chitin deacetylase (PgdA/CDA1 family)
MMAQRGEAATGSRIVNANAADQKTHGLKSLRRVGAALVAACLIGSASGYIASQFEAAAEKPATELSVTAKPIVAVVSSQAKSSFKTQTVYFAPNKKGQVFITIDDGYFPEQGAYNFLKSNKISTTSFIIKDAMDEHLGFWKAYAKIGNLEDHTVSHPNLTAISYAADVYQIEGQRNAIKALTGVTPYMLRPPYGDLDAQVVAAAHQSGMRYIVMWSAVLKYNANGVYTSDPPLETWNGGPLRSGEIIIVHWNPGVTGALKALYKDIERDGLKVGNLADYLTK